MKKFRNIKHLLIEIIESFWVPILFLILSIIFLFKLTNIKDKQTFQVVIGIVLGVVLGFTADIMKRSFDEYHYKMRLRKSSLKLLKDDAKGVYRTFWQYKNMQNAKNLPFNAQSILPPKLDLRYWSFLKKEKDFLLLASKPPFDQIFELIWDLEIINDQIEKAKGGDKQAPGLVFAFYNQTIIDKSHEKLLLFFMTNYEIENWIKSSMSFPETQ
ncbi:MAG: hypothetical protein KJ808_06350 [Acidobacteria bacterium]|nr:hypothetical protein [Acidobacteriota bacterium]MBU4306443.1 hypothetical protein [Acidobacteriota bacterium]MCG2811563.1 hypothetical protein [Candidatus Aminicenantes bacterium]